MLNRLYEFREQLLSHNLIFCYTGPLSQDLMAEIGDTLRMKMKIDEVNKSSITKVFSVLIEKSQNIIYYSAEKISKKESQLSIGNIAVGFAEGHYFVLCGNMVENQDVARLQEKLSKLQKMTKEEIKAYYKEQRKLEPEDGSQGAGLGFIEMARKAGRPIEFNFRKIDSELSFFTVKTTV